MGAPNNGERNRCVPGTNVPLRPGTIQTVRPDGTVETRWLEATGEAGDSRTLGADRSTMYMRRPPSYKRRPV